MLRAPAPTRALAFGARRRLAPQPPEPGRGRAGTLTDALGEQLAGWGTVLRLETRGRVTGRSLEVALGYLEEPDGTALVAAGDPDADWARNLEADPHGRATIGDRSFAVVAEPLEGAPAAAAIVGLILKYGTSAERLGRGPVFRLRPIAEVGA